jgi:hypothetical protein
MCTFEVRAIFSPKSMLVNVFFLLFVIIDKASTLYVLNIKSAALSNDAFEVNEFEVVLFLWSKILRYGAVLTTVS